MKVKYSAWHFKRNYDKLPPEIQRRFFFVDAEVIKGNLEVLKRQGWMYFVNLGPDHAEFGSVKEDGKVFLWRWIGAKEHLSGGKLPVIL